jgi:hypothetical protein
VVVSALYTSDSTALCPISGQAISDNQLSG